jgi:4-aminobutyrate aminotransferase/(S)-3-amino-2-methylpropionate transaminase
MTTSPDAAKLLEDRARFVPRGMTSSSSALAAAAEGTWITDVEGRRYLDFASGISVLSVGHRHPRIQAAIAAQLGELVHSGAPVMMPAAYVRLAKRLCEITPGSFEKGALLVNSGAEAVENAVKIVRQATGRSAILTFHAGFHGRTLLTMTMSGKVHPFRQNFGPYAPEVYHLPFPNPYRRPAEMSIEQWTDYCLGSVRTALVTDASPAQVAAICVEPVQGEGGFVVPSPTSLPRLAELCREHEIPLIVDEIQTGLGRTGELFASEHAGIEPDLILIAKSLGAGLPLAAVVGRAELMDSVDPGGIGGTYGGNPLACAAALAVLDVIREERLPQRAVLLGERILERMRG